MTWWRRDDGATPIEAAIGYPFAFLLLFAAIQAAMAFLAWDEALTAAQAAVSAQRVYQAPAGAGAARGTAYLRQSPAWLTRPQLTVSDDGVNVQATVTGGVVSLIPGVHWTIRQTVHGSAERLT